MPAPKQIFVCQSCGSTSPKWMGQCSHCHEWNTLVEEVQQGKQSKFRTKEPPSIYALEDIEEGEYSRLQTGNAEFDLTLGGGIVSGSVVLVGGEPGIGKSTLMLQEALKLAEPVLYVSGEESLAQVKSRAERLTYSTPTRLRLIAETDVQNILEACNHTHPSLVVVDSIQTIRSSNVESIPGSVSQIRQSASELIQYAKKENVAMILIGHITKEGVIAGPKILEHMVDVVLQFEGDPNYHFRILRVLKNRFGKAFEVGIFEMGSKGILPVSDPSKLLLSQHDEAVRGSAIGCAMQGSRCLLVEVQALISTAHYGTPQRSTTGFDNRRLNMLLAVLDTHLRIDIHSKDVFINVTGGIHIQEPSMDLSVVASILSSYRQEVVSSEAVFVAEIGLSGELRPVFQAEQRIAEAQKLGMKTAYISSYQTLEEEEYTIKIIRGKHITDFAEACF